jgi:hypothetical protein
MGAYSPRSDLLNASISQDTQGYAPGIAAAGQSIANGIGQWASNRAAAQAADVEYEGLQSMYPEAAANIDPEKFHAANLTGKQKLLGLAKGFVLEQQQKNEIMRKQALTDKENVLRSQLNTTTTKDGGTLIMTGDGRMVYSNRPDPVTPAPGPINEQTLPSGARVITQGGEIKRYLDAQQQPGGPKYEDIPMPDGRTLRRLVANGNVVSNAPSFIQEKGPMDMTPGGLPIRRQGKLTEIQQGQSPSAEYLKKLGLIAIGFRNGEVIYGRPRVGEAGGSADPAVDPLDEFFPKQ